MSSRVVVPVVAGLVGLLAGAVAALTDLGDGTATFTERDPLGLGVPLEQWACTGEGLLVVGYGDTVGPLLAAVADNPETELSYLETARSCETTFGPERLDTPAYAVVLGPYADLADACSEAMSRARAGDFVTRLRDGNQMSVKCVCVLPATAAPDLRIGMEADPTTRVWIRQLQNMLVDQNPKAFPNKQVTGVFDRPTSERVAQFQASASSGSFTAGEVGTETWQLLRRRICPRYEY